MTVLQTPAAIRFRAAMRTYCAHVESRHTMSPTGWLPRAHLLLVELYAAGLQLPSIEPDTDDASPEHGAFDDWKHMHDDLCQAFGPWNSYRAVFDPYDADATEPVHGSLADDFADIYSDVRRGESHEMKRGDAFPNDVMWEWRFTFESHWSRHAASAFHALSALQFTHYATAIPESLGTWIGARATSYVESSVKPPHKM